MPTINFAVRRSGGPQQWRADSATSRIIEQSIAVQACHGTFYAALLMRIKNIDIDTALRVLLHPKQRRSTFPPTLFHPRHYAAVPPLMYAHTHT